MNRAAAALAGAFMLARGRATGLALIDGSPAGAWASFMAMFLCVPGYAALRLLSDTPAAPDPLRAFAAETIGYVAGWFAFPLVMDGVTRAMDRAERYTTLVATWNWANVVQVLVLLGSAAVAAMGILPTAVSDVLALMVLGYILWLQWFVARTVLGVPGAQASFVVVTELVLGLFITGLTLSLAFGG